MSKTNAIPADHPLRGAKWIWPEAYMYLQNHYAQFRRDFELAEVPGRAPLFITADKAYRLYVNGTPVCRGPARGFQSHWPFDEVDLAPFLRPGRNWLSVEGYNPGTGSFQYVHQCQAGLLCAARWGGFRIESGDEGWIYRRSPGHNTGTQRYSMQLDYQEDIDLDRDDRSWILSPDRPQGWNPRYAPHAQLYTDIRYGRPPWDAVEPRGIPLLREEIVTPERVTARAEGESDPGYRTCANISWNWAREGGRIGGWQDGSPVAAERRDGWLELKLPPTGRGRFRSVTVDVGRMTVGVVGFEADGASGGEILDFQHDQTLRGGEPIFIPEGAACSIALGNRARLRPGANAHEFFHPLGFRHLTVIARDLTRPLSLRLRIRTALYPLAMRGSFESSDGTLNRIYEACRATQQLCSLDAYVDTPWREQAQWWGDARVQARNTFYMDGDTRLLVRGIRQIGGQRTPEGITYGHAPTVAYSCILPDFSLTWILSIYDHWWQTGDLKLFREQWPGIRRVLDYFRCPSARHASGLLRHDRRFWLFEDWSDLFKGEVPTFLNLWYLYTLRHLAVLLAEAGRARDAGLWKEEERRMTALVMERLFDRGAGMFLDGLEEDGTPVRRFSVHDQVLALSLGLAPEGEGTMMRERVLPFLRGEALDCAKPSAFWSTYVFEEAAKRGAGGDVLSAIRRGWTPMLSTGTTWEGFEWSETVTESCSHAWTAHPSFHLVNVLAGLSQTERAWRGVRFAPLFADGLLHASAVVPSPRGPIEARWERDPAGYRARLVLPKGVTAEVVLPDRKDRVEGKGTFDFGGR